MPPPLPRLAASLLLVLAASTGCAGLTAEEPPVADSIMVDVLVDLHLRDARLALFKDVPDGLRDSLLLHHGITEAAFQRAKAYYADHPEEYLQLYGAVLDRLSAEARPPNAGEDLSPDTTTAETTTVTKRLLQRVE